MGSAKEVKLLLPEGDKKRTYEYCVLPNGLACLLVSDPSSDSAAAAMNCSVGQFQDPIELPGLAHFCEHMLFMGTEKFKGEDEYSEFVTQHGGYTNAFTAYEDTNYQFTVNAADLDPTLEMFAQFFIAPLFTEGATDRELMAIESEDQKNEASDYMLFFMFLKDMTDTAHPASRFGNGSMDTLKTKPGAEGIDVRKHLLEFYERYYSANLMKLCVYGKNSTAELKAMVEKHFSQIKDKKLQRPGSDYERQNALKGGCAGELYYVASVKEDTRLHLTWVVSDSYANWEVHERSYWSHLLGHECEGSVLHLLKKRAWGSELVAGSSLELTSQQSIFEVQITLTEEGLRNVNEVIGIVFEYIAMVRRHGFSDSAWEEVAAVQSMEFRFKEVSDPFDHACGCAMNMAHLPPELAVAGDQLLHRKDPAKVMALGEELTPDRCIIALRRNKWDGVEGAPPIDRVSRFHSVKYGVRSIDKDLMRTWADPLSVSAGLEMPLSNPFIPTDFNVIPPPEVNPSVPQRIPVTVLPPHCRPQLGAAPEIELFHYHDSRFLTPKSYMRLQLVSAHAYSSPRVRIIHKVYVKLLREASNVFKYYAEVASLNLDTLASTTGLDILCHGFSHKLPELMRQFFEVVANYDSSQVTEEEFLLWAQKVKQETVNSTRGQAYSQATELMNAVTRQMQWTARELIEEEESCPVTLEDLRHHMRTFFSNVRVSMLVAGNVTRDAAVDFASKIQDIFAAKKCRCLPYSLTPVRSRIMQMVPGRVLLVPVPESNPNSSNSCVEVLYQLGPQSPSLIAVVDVFARLVSSPFFNRLRTEEQLGYCVFSGVRKQDLIEGIRFLVQSAIVPPWYIYSRIHAFVAALDKFIENVTQEKFDEIVKAEIANREDKPKTLLKQGETWYKCIETRELNFDAPETEIAALKVLRLEDLREFYFRYISHRSPTRRQVCTLVYSKEHHGAIDDVVTRWQTAGVPVLLTEKLVTEVRRDLTKEGASEVVTIESLGIPPEQIGQLLQAPPPDLVLGNGGEELQVDWVLNYGEYKQCCGAFPMWAGLPEH
eukprot:Hpha_TRINITY_DN5165_c0_g1::TRINITY_DN5165_c0_g1_i1::g.193167::m.193167/K01408/IDE, ide; insulysin